MKKLTLTIFNLIGVISFMINKTNFNLEETKVNILIDNKVEKMNLEDYVIGVVACEMPASFHKEALKSQGLASRTFAISRIQKNKDYVFKGTTSDQCFNTKKDMKNKWGKNYKKNYKKISDSVNSTKGYYLSYKEKPISALYFSLSNGYTENSENVYVSKKPYLKSVSSIWDKDNKNYEVTKTFKLKEVKDKLKLKQNIKSIKITNRYKTNRVKYVKVNNKKYKGTEFRKLLNLRSTDFDIEIVKEKVLITTRGYGHGVGMSQYGANSMAHLGYTYDEIVKYYYKNVEIKKYN